MAIFLWLLIFIAVPIIMLVLISRQITPFEGGRPLMLAKHTFALVIWLALHLVGIYIVFGRLAGVEFGPGATEEANRMLTTYVLMADAFYVVVGAGLCYGIKGRD